MNALLLSLLIVAAEPAASTGERYPGVTEVFRTDFGASADCDYDGWPDHWTRRHGPGFPLFNKIALCDQSPPGGGRSLRIDLDGGAAVAYSPPVPLDRLSDYLLEAEAKTEGVTHDRVFVSLAVVNAQGHRLQTFGSEKIRGSQQWTRLRLGPVSPGAAEGRFAVVGLHLEPAAKSDLKASALFGGIWLGRLPRIALTADTRTRIYTDPKQVAVDCTVSGPARPNARVGLELIDGRGNPVAREVKSLEPVGARGGAAGTKAMPPNEPALSGATARWTPSVPGPGFYRVRATLEGQPADLLRGEMGLTVIRRQRVPDRSEFGWSLPCGERPPALEALGGLLAQAGVAWVKCPLWFDSSQSEGQVAQVTAFLERMSSSGITVVGMLGRPPSEVAARFDPAQVPSAAEIFSAGRETWYPSVERTMLLVGSQVRWWQLGRDEDRSFVGYPDLEAKMAQVKGELDGAGYGVKLGIGWDWQYPLPSSAAGTTPWQFVSLSTDPPLSAQEIAKHLPTMRHEQVARWVLLTPLSRRDHTLEDRATDLVQRMVTAKLHGAKGIFASDPLDSEHGLMNDDGTPGDLFLPWRTAALVLGGAEPLESGSLPSGSPSRVFVRESDAAMLTWSRAPANETLYLGEDVRQVDLWGREQEVVKTDGGHRLDLGPLPVFVTGLSKPVALWRHAFALAADRIPSVFNERQANRIEFRNTFEQTVEGRVTLAAPEHWTIRPDRFTFRLKPGETLRQDFELTLPNNASSGRHLLEAGFELAAGRAYRFSVWRPIHVGLGQVRINLASRLNERGELEVQQRTVNEGEKPVEFRCQLFAPGRQRLATQVVGPGRGQDLKVYRFPNGRELIGKVLWLQAQETGGPQVLNYRFVAGQ